MLCMLSFFAFKGYPLFSRAQPWELFGIEKGKNMDEDMTEWFVLHNALLLQALNLDRFLQLKPLTMAQP